MLAIEESSGFSLWDATSCTANALSMPFFARVPIVLQVYVLNRDTASRLAISSPLEAHKGHAIIFHTCGVDVGFDNPIFAASAIYYLMRTV